MIKPDLPKIGDHKKKLSLDGIKESIPDGWINEIYWESEENGLVDLRCSSPHYRFLEIALDPEQGQDQNGFLFSLVGGL